MRDTLKIECLIEAMDRYWDAKREEEEARANYHGPSWGYFGRSYVDAKESAAEEIQKRLDEYIDARIAAVGQASREPQ
jgi:hypothetical protein